MQKLIALAAVGLLFSCQKERITFEAKVNSQEDVLTKEGIDSVLSTLEKVEYADLPPHYQDYAHPNRQFETELRTRHFYAIHSNETHIKVVGNYPIEEFLAHDDYFKEYRDNPDPEFVQYWLIDENVLYMMLDLIHELKDMGLNEYGFHIRNSHRHPKHNTDNNGASYSQHMFGRAIDIGIDDINNDGEETQSDKSVVYDLLEDIVQSDGGLGKYPGTMNLHFDCRGFRARWDFP